MRGYFTLLLALVCFCLAGCLATVTEPAVFERPLVGAYGQVFQAEVAAAGGWVYAYKNPRGSFRGPADYAARVEADGHYVLDLLPGEWHLVARNRHQGGDNGPPRAGDAWATYPANPLRLTAGASRRVDFKLVGVSQPMVLRGDSLGSGDTGFTGRLIDAQGQPVTGAFALAYRDSDFRRMPDYTSAAVGSDGRFSLYVPEPGLYCLAGRQRTRGQPIQGELYGTLNNSASACRKVVDGKIIAVGDIRLTPYLR